MSAPATTQVSQSNLIPLDEQATHVQQESSGSGVLQIIETSFAADPRRMANYLVCGLGLLIGCAVLALGYLLTAAISFHDATAQSYLAAIGAHAASAVVLLLGGLGLWAAPSPVKR